MLGPLKGAGLASLGYLYRQSRATANLISKEYPQSDPTIFVEKTDSSKDSHHGLNFTSPKITGLNFPFQWMNPTALNKDVIQ